MKKRMLKVQMLELLDAMQASDDDPASFFVDLETGDVLCSVPEEVCGVPDEVGAAVDEDPERYASVPHSDSHEAYRQMERFAETVDDADVRDLLEIALAGKGAFRRFRDVVHRDPDLEARWRAHERAAQVKEACEWLESLGIEPRFELPPLPEPAPPSARSQSVLPFDLMDVLLLGAPDGKTEVIDGRIHRLVPTGSPDAARRVFRHLAREICGWFGVPWRKRLVEGRTTFSVDRVELAIEGSQVWLRIAVRPGSVKALSGR